MDSFDYSSLFELLKLGVALVTLGSVGALRLFIRREASSTLAPLTRDVTMLHEHLDELRDEHIEHMEVLHNVPAE